jgi:hypothetical protein
VRVEIRWSPQIGTAPVRVEGAPAYVGLERAELLLNVRVVTTESESPAELEIEVPQEEHWEQAPRHLPLGDREVLAESPRSETRGGRMAGRNAILFPAT